MVVVVSDVNDEGREVEWMEKIYFDRNLDLL